MFTLKIIILFFIILICTYIGILKSRKYLYRVHELKTCLNCLNIFKNKVTFTNETIPSIFLEIANSENSNISEIFKISSEYMKRKNAKTAWENALEDSITNLEPEDILALKTLGNLLRKNR